MRFSGKKNIDSILGFVKESQKNSDSFDLLILCEDGSMGCHSFGLIAGSSFWRELLSDKVHEEKICITLTEFRMEELQSMLDFVCDGTLKYCEKDRLKLFEVTRNVLPDLKMFKEGNKGAYMTNSRNEPIHDLDLTCKICFKYFASKKECENHTERMHINKEVYVGCTICKRKFKTQTALESHIKTIHNEHMKEENICPTCGSKYGYARDLRRHCMSKGHDFPKPKPNIKGNKEACAVCGTFVVNIEYHMEKRHKDNKILFHCEKCSDTFDRKDNLRRHESLVHEMFDTNFAAAAKLLKVGTSMWQCKQCKKTFNDVRKLEDHLILKSCTENICRYCQTTFKEKHNLTKHIKNVHIKKDSYKCDKCQKEYSLKKSFNRHIKTCTGK